MEFRFMGRLLMEILQIVRGLKVQYTENQNSVAYAIAFWIETVAKKTRVFKIFVKIMAHPKGQELSSQRKFNEKIKEGVGT